MYRCYSCKSEKIQGVYWVDHNTLRVVEAVEPEKNWCENCEELVEIYDDELLIEENDKGTV